MKNLLVTKMLLLFVCLWVSGSFEVMGKDKERALRVFIYKRRISDWARTPVLEFFENIKVSSL